MLGLGAAAAKEQQKSSFEGWVWLSRGGPATTYGNNGMAGHSKIFIILIFYFIIFF
jgi:hypothetical protein